MLDSALIVAVQFVTLRERDLGFFARPAGFVAAPAGQQNQELVQPYPLHGQRLQIIEDIGRFFAFVCLQVTGKARAEVPCRSLGLALALGPLPQGIRNFRAFVDRCIALQKGVQRGIPLVFQEDPGEGRQVGSCAKIEPLNDRIDQVQW